MSSSSNKKFFDLWDRKLLNNEVYMDTPDWIKEAWDSLEKNPHLIPDYVRYLCRRIILPGSDYKLSRLGVSLVILAKTPGFPKELVSLGYKINQSVPNLQYLNRYGHVRSYFKALKARRIILKYVNDNF